MKSKITLVFEKCKKEKRPALITYTVAGDNTKNNSLKILDKISRSGYDSLSENEKQLYL